jgi:hypothetical protein
MNFVLCLFLLAVATLGQCKRKKDTLTEFGLTEAEINSLVDDHNEWRKKANSSSMYKLVSKKYDRMALIFIRP